LCSYVLKRRNAGWPKRGDPHGHGAWIVLVGLTTEEARPGELAAGEAKQVLGAYSLGGARDALSQNKRKAHRKREQALESAVPGNSHAAFGGGPGEKGCLHSTSPAAYPTARATNRVAASA
jgi:hypothetical protein